MARLLVCSLVFVLLVAAPASGSIYDRKQRLDDQAQALQSKADQARAREDALRAEIASVSQRIQALEAEVGDVSSRLAASRRISRCTSGSWRRQGAVTHPDGA